MIADAQEEAKGAWLAMTAYIRTIGEERALMVRVGAHVYINAAFAVRERMPIDGRPLTPKQVAAKAAAAEPGDDVAEAA